MCPNPYTGADSFPTTIDVVEDGDPPEAASWAPADEGNRDAVVWLRNRLYSIDTDFMVHIPLTWGIQIEAVDEWEFYGDLSLGLGWRQKAVNGDILIFGLTHHPGMRIKDIDVLYNPQTGRGGLPASQPGIKLARAVAPSNVALPGSYSEIADWQHSAGSLVAYESTRFQSAPTLAAVDTDFRIEDPMFLFVYGESGANATVDLLFLERIALRLEEA